MPIAYEAGDVTKKGTRVTSDTIAKVAKDDATTFVIMQNNLEQARSAMNSAMVAALSEMGLTCEAFAKGMCPVDTGRLRNSITWALDAGGNRVFVGTNVEYAYSVHEGTESNSNKGPRRFLRDAVTNYRAEYEQILRKHLRNAG